MKPISVQLYSLREESQADFDGVLSRLAEIGYRGVEPFNLFGKEPAAFRRQVEDLGMEISSSHFPWANRTEPSELIDTLSALGLRRAAGGFMADGFADLDAVKRTAETLNALIEQLAKADMELFIHNHWWEFEVIDGKFGHHHIAELCPDLLFEVDTYWAANFGAVDAVAEVARVKHRTPYLHIKDGPLVKKEANVAVGDGSMDIRGVIEAADDDVLEWLIVELDACDTDMMTAVEDSYRYLTREGLAAGRA